MKRVVEVDERDQKNPPTYLCVVVLVVVLVVVMVMMN